VPRAAPAVRYEPVTKSGGRSTFFGLRKIFSGLITQFKVMSLHNLCLPKISLFESTDGGEIRIHIRVSAPLVNVIGPKFAFPSPERMNGTWFSLSGCK
jgi:hypothetical protein